VTHSPTPSSVWDVLRATAAAEAAVTSTIDMELASAIIGSSDTDNNMDNNAVVAITHNTTAAWEKTRRYVAYFLLEDVVPACHFGNEQRGVDIFYLRSIYCSVIMFVVLEAKHYVSPPTSPAPSMTDSVIEAMRFIEDDIYDIEVSPSLKVGDIADGTSSGNMTETLESGNQSSLEWD